MFLNKQKPQNCFLAFPVYNSDEFFPFKASREKKLGFNSGDVDFAKHFTIVLAALFLPE